MQSSLFGQDAAAGEAHPASPVQTTWESVFSTPLGPMVAVTDRSNLLSLNFCARPARPAENELGLAVGFQLDEYFSGKREEFDIPVRLIGTPFQVRVWKVLQAIPYGKTVCYSEIAERLGVRNGQRAVGMANRVNPVAVIVPCHRVIQADGQLCGYAGGLWRKQHLLGLESGQRGLF